MANDLVPAGQNQYMVLASNPEQTQQIIRANLGNRAISPTDLDRVKIPSGGGISWEIPNIECPGGIESTQFLDGIIIHHKDVRVYFPEDDNNTAREGNHPDCFSDDGIHGISAPGKGLGGLCADCPLSKWDSGKDGRQACKEMKQLFIVRENSLLPLVVSLPPTSIKSLVKYFMAMSSRGWLFSSAITRLTLRKEQKDPKTTYSVVEAQLLRRLTTEECACVEALASALRPALDRVRADSHDVNANHAAAPAAEQQAPATDAHPSESPAG